MKNKKIQEEINVRRQEEFLQAWREKKRRKWLSKHKECCGQEEEMEELERRRGSRVGRLMKERTVRFEDEGRNSGGENKGEQVAVMVHNEGQEGDNRCMEEEDEERIQEMEGSKEDGYKTESSISVEGESIVSMGADGEVEEEDEEEEEEDPGKERMYETDSSVTVDGESVFTEV